MALRATTHTDLQIRARQRGIKVEVIHNASILNAIGACGLQLYRYGEVTPFAPRHVELYMNPKSQDAVLMSVQPMKTMPIISGIPCLASQTLVLMSMQPARAMPINAWLLSRIASCCAESMQPGEKLLILCLFCKNAMLTFCQHSHACMQAVSIVFFTDTWRPDSFYDRILANRQQGLHTLCLLDIKVKEPSLESLARGKKVYEPARYMTVNTAVEQLLEVEDNRKLNAFSADSLAVGVARIGAPSQQIVAGTMQELLDVDFGDPLHSLVIPGNMHVIESEFLQQFQLSSSS